MAVYVVQEVPGRNILSAEAYGQLIVLLPSRMQIMVSALEAVEMIGEKIKTFSDQDYLLAIGDPVAIGLASIVAARRNGGRVKFLKWDREEKRYYVVQTQVLI
jgi:hypothetical protein